MSKRGATRNEDLERDEAMDQQASINAALIVAGIIMLWIAGGGA